MLKFLKALNGELLTVIGIVCAAGLLLWTYSCTPTTQSLLTPQTQVSRLELLAEVEMFNARLQGRIENLEQQEQFRSLLFDQAAIVGSGGTLNPLGILTSLAAVLGLGATADNIRKRKVISGLKAPK